MRKPFVPIATPSLMISFMTLLVSRLKPQLTMTRELGYVKMQSLVQTAKYLSRKVEVVITCIV